MSQYTIKTINPDNDSTISHFRFFVKDGSLILGTGTICNKGTDNQFYRYAGHGLPDRDHYESVTIFANTYSQLLTRVKNAYSYIMPSGKTVFPDMA